MTDPKTVTSIKPHLSSKYDALFLEEGREHNVDPNLLAALAKQESNFNPKARSHVGAAGLMQFMPETAKGFGIDPWNEHQAVDGAARYIRKNMDAYGNNIRTSLAAYNAGGRNVHKYGKGHPHSVPPCSWAKCETFNYVKSITAMYYK